MVNCLYCVLCLDLFAKPILTKGSKTLDNMLGITIDVWPNANDLSPYLISLLSKITIQNVAPLYQKIDNDIIVQEQNKLLKTK
jgi:methionyl-tRNA synthetase